MGKAVERAEGLELRFETLQLKYRGTKVKFWAWS